MRIAIFTQHYYPENFRINYIVQELKKNNQIFIFTSKPHYNLEKKYIEKYKKKYSFVSRKRNLEIIRFPVWFKKKNYLSKLFNYLSYIINISFYLLSSKKKKVDIIFVYATSPIFQCIPAILYKFMTKKPLIIWVQDLWPEVLLDLKIPFSNLISSCVRPIIYWIYNSCDIVLCQSESFKKEISKLTNKKTLLYENPSDVVNNKIIYSSRKNIFSIVFAGNLGDAQNLDIILKVGQLIRNNQERIRIYILGDGKKFLFLKNAIKAAKLSKFIILKKYIPPNQVSKYYLQSSALLINLVPGSGISKTVPAKFQSYLAWGRPILVCSDGVINQIVKKNNLGLVCSSGNIKKLYYNITLLKNMDYKEYKKISFNCFDMYKKKYTIFKKTEELMSIFKYCIKNFKY
jgi:glycosyltransferase involved in cell wall biosynthesis